MIILSFSILLFILVIIFYQRYVPVWGMKEVEEKTARFYYNNDVLFIDTRDYQISYKDKQEDALCIPLPYLHRHYVKIPIDRDLMVIASDRLECNLSIRYLRKKGFHVIGYYMPNNMKKGEYYYGIQCTNDK